MNLRSRIIREMADTYIRGANHRISLHHEWAGRVAEWEKKNGEFNLMRGGKDYWDDHAWQLAYRRYTLANPQDPAPLPPR